MMTTSHWASANQPESYSTRAAKSHGSRVPIGLSKGISVQTIRSSISCHDAIHSTESATKTSPTLKALRNMAATALPTLLLLLLLAAVTAAADGNAPPPKASSEFILTSCSATLYPTLCYSSLSGYSSVIQDDPIQLAWVAANVSLSRVLSVRSHVYSLSPAGMSQRAAAALRDCRDALGDAADLTRKSEKELGLLGAAEGEEISWRVSNAQTWMSAALTNEDTCGDGFQAAVAPGPMRNDVCCRVRRAKQFTSNALALVNHLVAGGHRL